MGYDVSYHALAIDLIDEQFIPHVLGESTFSERLRATAVRRALTRRRANNWGLGCSAWMREHSEVAAATGFDSHLHVWGRPFFIAEREPLAVAGRIDAWHRCAGDEDCDALARAQLEVLAEGLSSRVNLADDHNAPDANAIASMLFEKPDILRDAVAALRRGEPLTMHDGSQRDPADVLSRHVPYVAVEFAAQVHPGWMDRGPVAPTMVLMAAGYLKAVDHFFVSPAVLFESITEAFPGVSFEHLGNRLTSNYALGGLAPPHKVAELRHFLTEDPRIVPDLREAMAETLGIDEPDLVLRKWTEALTDAQARDLPFIEASEIYSGIEGRMN